jgi:hypothetical protein
MKLTGGSPSLAAQLNLEAFLDQARSYDSITRTELGELLKQAQTNALTHPLPVLRAREIEQWAQTQAYASLLQCGNSATAPKVESAAQPAQGRWLNW